MNFRVFFTAALLLAAAPLAAQTGGSQPKLPAASAADSPASTRPVSLAGLWSLEASADFDMYDNSDVLSYYPAYSTTLPQGSTFLGFSARGSYHFSDAWYLGAGMDWLSKGFSVTDQVPDGAGNTATYTQAYQWNALFPSLTLGWSFLRGVNSCLALEGSLGPVLLENSSYQESGSASEQASFSGASLGGTLGLSGAWFIVPCLSAEFQAGYRFAYLGAVSVQSSDPENPVEPVDGKAPFVDFSGPVVKVGLGLYFGMKNPWGDLAEPEPGPAPTAR